MEELPFRILIVDDNVDEMRLTRAATVSSGLSAIASLYISHSAEGALDMMENQLEGRSLDLIISDVNMPRMSGFELIRSMRERGLQSGTPVFMLSQSDYVSDIQECISAGISAFIRKPSELDTLIGLFRFIRDSLQAFGLVSTENLSAQYIGQVFYPYDDKHLHKSLDRFIVRT
jgi:CheY-like chemotaxis protein